MEVVLIFWIVCAVACALVASSKGRSSVGWFILGLLFSVFALVIVACLSSVKKLLTATGEPIPTPLTHVKCPDCAELVRKEAVKCKHCGCVLMPQ